MVFRRFALPFALSTALLTSTAFGICEARAAGTLIWGMPAETDTLDPHATGGWSTYQITYQIFEGLVKEDLTKADVATPPLIPVSRSRGPFPMTVSSIRFIFERG